MLRLVPLQLAHAPLLLLPKGSRVSILSHSIRKDHAMVRDTLRSIVAFDAHPYVFVVLAHDASMDGEDERGGGIVSWYSASANEWKAKNMKEAVRWMLLEPKNPTYRWG